MVTITDEDIKKERSLINNKIAEIKKELSNDINFIEDTEDKNNLQNYLKTLENISETDIKNLIIWKKENHKENEELHKFVEQDFILQMEKNMIPQEEELFSYNDKHPLYTLINSNTQRKTSIRIDENVTKNIKNIGKLKTIKEADDLIKKIKASGLDILSTDTRVILYDKDKFYDFDMYYGHFNDVFLDEYDFIDYIKKDCRITKRMKDFEKLPSEVYLNNINQKKEKQYFLHTKNQKQESNMIVQENELQINELLKQAGWNYSFDEEENIASWKNPKTMQELIIDWNTHEYKYSELDNLGTWILDPSFDSDAAEKFIFDKISANEKQKKSIENIHETTSTTGVPYFTENDNIFIAPENISQEEYEKLSYETDVNVFKDEIAKLKKQIEELTAKLENKIEQNNSEVEEAKTAEITEEIPDIPVLSYVTNEPFTGNNINIAQTFRKYLIDNNKASADEQIILISQAQAESYGGKIKDNAEACVITCPPDEQHDDFWQEQYYYINDVEGLNQDNTIQESNQKETTKDSIKPEVGMKLPEQIAIITQKGLIAIDNTEVLAVSEDGTQITIGNSEQSVVVEPDTFDELMKPSEKINENQEAYNKLPETMYNDFFNPREPNCADNFRHNLSVYCREKANSPIDALELAKQLIQNMPKNEQKRTKNLIEKCRKPWQNINEALIEIYEDAVKEVPLNEQWIKNNAPGKYIPRQLTDVITSEGNKIDRDSDLKIGSVLNDVVLTNNKVFGKGKEKINVGELKIVAASKENNSITLMSKDKSYYELPRDTVLAAYNHNLITKNKNHSIEIER